MTKKTFNLAISEKKNNLTVFDINDQEEWTTKQLNKVFSNKDNKKLFIINEISEKAMRVLKNIENVKIVKYEKSENTENGISKFGRMDFTQCSQ